MKKKTKKTDKLRQYSKSFRQQCVVGTLTTLLAISCQSSNERASANKPDSLAMEQGLNQDSMKQDSANENVPNKGANAISSKAQIDDDQANFMKEAAMGSLMEIQAGKLAIKVAKDQRVKDFGSRMVADHTKASSDLKLIAEELGVLIPTALAGTHADHLKMLGSKSGSAFDKIYMDMMVMDHDKTVKLFELYTSARNPSVANFANKHLPAIKDHFRQAKAISVK